MPFCDFHWFSKSIAKQVASYVLLPEVGEGPFAVFYLLHGLSDDHTIWQRRTRIEEYVAGLPLIVVMPDGFRGFYTKNEEGPDYDAYMAEELPAVIERYFPAQRTRAGRCIGGLSMGGYGALRLALAHPDRYVSANSHSGALMRGSKSWTKPEQAEMRRIVGAAPKDTDHDLEFLARRAQSAGILPQLRIDCGTEDFLFEENQTFHAFLNELSIPHEYAEYPGAHTWPYWDEHVREAIAFHCKALGITKQ
jgi:S-formylglutathione hydrolase FrmB